MAAIITEIIPQQGFELVGERIGAVLALELANQKALQSLPDGLEVFRERITPYDKSEDVMVNVLLNNITFSNFTESNAEGGTVYYVDIYTTGIASPGKTGGQTAAALLQRYLGMARYILQSTKYKTLDFAPGTIAGTYVENIQIYDIEDNQDAANVKMGRLTFRVRIYEGQNLWEGVDMGPLATMVKLQETEKGYKYELNN
ncbi:hypothetical protein C7967_11539 [Thalassospira sp. 11-3]|nr:hypothetical protein C7967_11539 [Thalassospira sp. 11-3]